MAEFSECGYVSKEPVEKNPSRSPADLAKTKEEDLGDIRASLPMDDAQYLGKRVQRYPESDPGKGTS